MLEATAESEASLAPAKATLDAVSSERTDRGPRFRHGFEKNYV